MGFLTLFRKIYLAALLIIGVAVGTSACDDPALDTDGDGVLNGVDNCPRNANPRQEDFDRNKIGNVCDVAFLIKAKIMEEI